MAKVDPGTIAPGPGGLVGPAYGDPTGKTQVAGGWKKVLGVSDTYSTIQKVSDTYSTIQNASDNWKKQQETPIET